MVLKSRPLDCNIAFSPFCGFDSVSVGLILPSTRFFQQTSQANNRADSRSFVLEGQRKREEHSVPKRRLNVHRVSNRLKSNWSYEFNLRSSSRISPSKICNNT